MIAPRRRFADRRQITVGDAERVQIGHRPGGIGKRKPAMQLQRVRRQWNCGLWWGHDARLSRSACREEGCGSTTNPDCETWYLVPSCPRSYPIRAWSDTELPRSAMQGRRRAYAPI